MRDTNGWVGLGGGTKVLLACSNANKTRKPQNQKIKKDRQTTKQRCNNCCDTHEDPRKKKRKEQGQGPMFQFLAW